MSNSFVDANADMPRERMVRLGPRALSDAELLAILARTGTTEHGVVELMQQLLDSVDGNLDRLGELTYKRLTAINGIGPAKATAIMAACELGRRRMESKQDEREVFSSPQQIFEKLLRPLFWDLNVEESWALYFSKAMTYIGRYQIGKGGLTSVTVDIKSVLRSALEAGASAMVLAHNHLSGNVKPSSEDNQLTTALKNACEIMQIRLTDHIIVSSNTYYSYTEAGKM